MCSETKKNRLLAQALQTIRVTLHKLVAAELPLMLRLHYVPGGHGSHDFGHRGRHGVTVTQRRGTGLTNVARRGCRDRRYKFLNSQKNCHGSTAGLTYLNVP